jgi:transposase
MPGIDPYGGFTIPDRLHVDALSFDGELLTISGSVRGSEAHCPVCDQTSRRVHSHYTRTLADLPWSGTPVRLRLQVRKFFCDEPACERRIFAERLGGVARVRARGTDRRREALEWIAFALGGEAGARLARELGLLVSPDTLLKRIRETFFSEGEDVRVVGVDDFGFRRGHASGTILVDLERRRVVDLFEGHSVESIARWLGQHPSVEVVGRDRSNVCREGANAGAPDALQVADRWHLLRSLALGLEEFLLRKRSALEGAAASERGEEEEEPLPGSIDDDVSTLPVRLGRPYGSIEGPAQKRHERLLERWKHVRRLHLAGASAKDIAEWVGTSRSTVYRYRELAEPPPRPRYRRRASVLDPYLPYLLERWNEVWPQRQAAPRRDPREGLPSQHRHGEQAALQLPLHGATRQEAFPRPEGQEGQHRRRLPDRQERGGPVHAPPRDAQRGAEGVPGEAVYLGCGPGRRAQANPGVREDGPRTRRREARQMA